MHDHLRHLVIGSCLLLGACDVESDFESEPSELDQPTPIGTGIADEVSTGTTGELRSIAGLDPSCVDVRAPIIMRVALGPECEFEGFDLFDDKWVAASLFQDGSPMLQGLLAGLPSTSPLMQFCRYNYIGTSTDPYADYAEFIDFVRDRRAPSNVHGETAAVDCPVMAPMTDEGLDTAAGREALHEAFMSNVHAISAKDLDEVPRYDTRLVLLDTVAEGVAPYNEHGLLLEKLIADIACPGDASTCMDWIEHVLVTPRVPEDDYATADWDGGNVGYMHEFSMGLTYAVMDWASDNVYLPPEDKVRLIVSAAIGADPTHPIASDPSYAPAQSAIAALQAAYCMGAVVYAAAGNTRDNSCPNLETGMLAPASYESFVVPTEAQCSIWGYLDYAAGETYAPGSPLIHAVGGVDGGDHPIANHRRDANPRLHATAANAISSDGTVAITGTSVATAVAAGAHLLMWSLDPEPSANEIVTQLYDTGYPTGDDANAGMYASDPVHRLDICQALDENLLDLACANPSPDPANLDDFLLAVEDAIEVADLAELLITSGTPLEGTGPDCSLPTTFDDFIKPQPERPACSNCNGVKAPAGNTHMLNMSIANQTWMTDLYVTAAYLHTYDAAGNATTFNLAAVVPSINAAIPTNVIQVPFTTGWPASAVLEFSYYDQANNKYTKVSNSIPLIQY